MCILVENISIILLLFRAPVNSFAGVFLFGGRVLRARKEHARQRKEDVFTARLCAGDKREIKGNRARGGKTERAGGGKRPPARRKHPLEKGNEVVKKSKARKLRELAVTKKNGKSYKKQ